LPLGIGRLDRGWEVRPEARTNLHRPPSRLLGRLHVDCITWSEAALRFLIDTLGVERVVLGSDWPYDMGIEAPAAWISAMTSVTEAEKAAILGGNAGRLLDGVEVA
jgi:aminocarboxymuconate-semialdehyde decarboxylase